MDINLPIVINVRNGKGSIAHLERDRDSTICGRRITYTWERQGKTDSFCKRCEMLSLRPLQGKVLALRPTA